MFYVYVLYSQSHDRLYIGMTQDKVKRLVQHNSGYNQSTKAYLPWILLFSEEYGSRELARDGEKKLKTNSGRRFIRKNYLPIR